MSNPRIPYTAKDADDFIELFGGLDRIGQIGAYGTGQGQWIKQRLTLPDVVDHLNGIGPGIGVPPLGPDNMVSFAAIDLDEPDFAAAREMQNYLPARSFVERSRSGNAHVWVFFDGLLDAWVAMGILKEATLAAGKEYVEVFPKNFDFERVKYGNYINLPYHGDKRPVLNWFEGHEESMPLDVFLAEAEKSRNDPDEWRSKARWLNIEHPGERERVAEFGTQPTLHMCAEYIVAHRDDNPVVTGHRNAVYFALAKQLTNCSMFDHDEAFEMMNAVNDASPDRVPLSELRRILANAERGQYTSTDCDNPLVAPFTHPDCPIAHPRR